MRLEPINPQQLLTGEITPTETNPIKYQKYRTNESGLVVIDKNEDLSFSRNFLPLYAKTYNKTAFDTVIKNEFEEFITTSGNTPIAFLQSQLTELQSQRDSLLAVRDSNQELIADLQRQIDELTRVTEYQVIYGYYVQESFSIGDRFTSRINVRNTNVCILFNESLYPIVEKSPGEITSILDILQLNGKSPQALFFNAIASYSSVRLPVDAIALTINPGIEVTNSVVPESIVYNANTQKANYNAISFLTLQDIKQIINNDLTPLEQNT
jgi:hypothetical protein